MGSRRVGSLRARSFTGCRWFQDDVFVLELSSILLSSYFRLMSSGRPNLRENRSVDARSEETDNVKAFRTEQQRKELR